MEENKGLRFIIDEPAEVDFFNTHSPVATAIARAITTNPALKIVGVIGRWGSGKSTIVREVGRRLSTEESSYHVFTYDAWLHQHDPLRRSFLESIASFLGKEGAIDKSRWQKRLDRLSGAFESTDSYSTPAVTPEAKQFFIVSILFAFGIVLAKDNFEKALAYDHVDSSLWALRLALLMILVPTLYWSARYIFLKSFGKDASFFPRILLNKEITHTNVQTKKDIEPTSIEFGSAFRDMMLECQKSGFRIVIVIDNIDRLNEDDAMALWGSVRSFFLSSEDDNNINTQSYHPTVILPVDGQSIAQMFSIGSDEKTGDALAQSFINKTFDVTFDVPRPVMSDWKNYLKEKMLYSFGSFYSEERYFSTQLFVQSWFDVSGYPITPREINKLLNKIVAMLIQWGLSGVAFETISYFSIFRKNIDGNIVQAVSDETSPLRHLVSDWRRELAALHFGVSVEHAAQVLMAGPMRQAFISGDSVLLEPYRGVSGFGEIFEIQTRNLPSDERGRVSPLEVITNAGALLSAVSGEVEEVWQQASWRNLIRAFNGIPDGVVLNNIDARVSPFVAKIDEVSAPGFVSVAEKIISVMISDDKTTPKRVNLIGLLGDRIVALAEKYEMEQPKFDFDGSAEIYLSRILLLEDHPKTQARVRGSAGDDDITSELVRRIGDEQLAGGVPSIYGLLTGLASDFMINGALDDGGAVIAAAENVVRSNPPGSSLFRSGIMTLAAGEREARQVALSAFERLADDGTFANGLGAVAQQRQEDTLALIIAMMIRRGLGVASPIGSRWSEFFSIFPDIADNINNVMDKYCANTESQLDMFLISYNAGFRGEGLIANLFERRIRSGRLGRLHPDKILSNLYIYSRMVDWRLRDRLAMLLASNYDKFVPSMQEVPWTEGVFEAASRLQRGGGAVAVSVNEQILTRLRNTPPNEWIAAITNGIEPFKVATQFPDRSALKLGVGSELLDALMQMVASENLAHKAVQTRWFDLSDLLTVPARRKAMEALGRELSNKAPTVLLSLLKAGGTRLLNEGHVLDDVDVAIENVLLPLSKSQKGREWLRDRKAEIRHLLNGADSAAIERVRKMVRVNAKAKDADKRHWASMVQTEWNIG